MALIGEIRKHSGLLVGTIAVSIVGFLVMDATNSQTGFFNSKSDNIGYVNGNKITYRDFNNAYDKTVKMVEDQRGRGASITELERDQIKEQTWNDFINTGITEKITDNLGLTVSDDELIDLTVGNHPHQMILQNFSNPQTGQFDANAVKMFIQNVDIDEKGQEPGTKRKMWTNFLDGLKKMQFNEKYNTLVAKGLNTPSWMAEKTFVDENKTADFKYVAFPHSEINDADLKITDAELKDYLNSHKGLFKQEEETRKVAYMVFNVAPSSADSANAFKYLENIAPGFLSAANKSADSAYVKGFSETPFNNDYFTKEQLANTVIGNEVFGSPVGKVFGPYVENGQFKYAKISGKKMISDSLLFKTITFSFNDVKDENGQKAKYKLIDSIYRALDSSRLDFNAAVAMNGSDAEKATGGNAKWIKFGEFSGELQPINSLLFYDAKVGKPVRYISPNENAIKIAVLVAEQPSKEGVQIAYLTKSIVPSPETEKDIYGAASTFAQKNNTEAKFKAAMKANPIKNAEAVRKQDNQIAGLEGDNARSVVRWAYEAKKGDVSNIITVNNKHIVAFLEAIREKGTPELDAVKEQVKFFYTRDKKNEMITKKIEAQKSASIDDVAAKNNKQVALAEKALFANPMIGPGAYEPNVVAAAINAPANKLSAPILGNAATFVLTKVSETNPAKPNPTELGMYYGKLKQKTVEQANKSFEVLKKLIDVKDNRFDFF